jgi:hypothetical protein
VLLRTGAQRQRVQDLLLRLSCGLRRLHAAALHSDGDASGGIELHYADILSGLLPIGQMLSLLRSLCQLSLWSCALAKEGDCGDDDFSAALAQLTTLTRLELSDCAVMCGLEGMLKVAGQLPQLADVALIHIVHISKRLPEQPAVASSVTRLHVRFEKRESQPATRFTTVAAIADSLGRMAALRQLSLAGLILERPFAYRLVSGIARLQSLQSFELRDARCPGVATLLHALPSRAAEPPDAANAASCGF